MNVSKRFFLLLLLANFYRIPINSQVINSVNTHFTQINKHKFKFNRIDNSSLTDYLEEIVQDHLGFLWIAAMDGVYRYDGYEFKKYKIKIPKTKEYVGVNQIYSGLQNEVWVITYNNSLYKYTPSLDRFDLVSLLYKTDTTTFALTPTSLVIDKKFIWLSTKNNGLVRMDATTHEITKTNISFFLDEDNEYIKKIAMDKEGNIWGLSNQLFKIELNEDRSEVKTVKTYPTLKAYPISSNILATDSLGNIWMVNGSSVLRYNPVNELITVFDIDPTEKFYKDDFKVSFLKVLSNGQVWLSYETVQGIVVLDPSQGKVQLVSYERNDPYSISHNGVLDVYEDGTGIIWVATFGGGLNWWSPNYSFGHYRAIMGDSNALSNDKVTNFLETDAQTLWICTKEGLNKLDKPTHTFSQYYPTDFGLSPRSNIIHSIAPDVAIEGGSVKKLWLGTKEGLLYFDINSGIFTPWKAKNPAAKVLEYEFIPSLVRDDNNTLWAITGNHKLFKFNDLNNDFEPIELFSSEWLTSQIHTVKPVGRHKVWIGLTNNGAWYEFDLRSEESSQINYINKNNFTLSSVANTYEDEQGVIWISSNNGLYRYVPQQKYSNKASYEVSRFLSSEILYGIIAENDSTIWLSTLRNIIKFNPNTESMNVYSQQHGIQRKNFGIASYKSPYSKDYYFGGIDGFNIFQPNLLSFDTISPSLAITDLTVFTAHSEKQIAVSLEDGSTTYPPIHLYHGDKILQIRYAALHFLAPNLNQYAIQLDGYDRDWCFVQNKHEVNYTNLSSGKYTFKVKASNRDGVWNEIGISLPIIVHPPIWATWWAFFIYAIVSLASILGMYNHQMKRKLEKKEAEKLKALHQIKSNLFNNVAHELKTPLTLIKGPIESLIQSDKSQRYNSQQLLLIQRNADKLLNLTEEILIVSKMDNTDIKIKESKIKLYPLLTQIIAAFHYLANIHRIELEFHYELPEDTHLRIDVPKFEKVINNLLSNAIKFNRSGGQVKVIVGESNDWIQLSIQDTGIGIHEKDLPYIFDRYYQSQHHQQTLQGGTGIGLALCKEYVTLFNGTIEVKSEQGTGSVFNIFLPRERVWSEQDDRANTTIANETVSKVWTNENSLEEQCRILIVEDNTDMQLYVSQILQEALVCQIDTANNGAEALEYIHKAEDNLPDLIISDVMMPVMDGLQLLAHLKQSAQYRHLPVILLTVRSEKEDRFKGLTLGVDDYLTKPFYQEELLASVVNLLEHHFARKEATQESNPSDTTELENAVGDIEWIKSVQVLIEDHIENAQLSAEFIADKIGLSERHLRRRIKQITGITFGKYIKEIKLQTARRLLESDDKLTITEISHKVGFYTPAYFARIFKERFGKLPSDYFKYR